MQRIVHLVVTRKFAGVERYVATTASEVARRGYATTVVGGDPEHMPRVVGTEVRWLPGATAAEALRSLATLGGQDVCHAHMTMAEVIAVAARPLHRAPVVSTRHFAAPRGSVRATRLLAPVISAALSFEIAASEYIASRIERRPDTVLLNAVPASPNLWRPESRLVLVAQRLEAEKDTITALRAWQTARMWEEGWSLRVVGRGSQREALEAWVRSEAVPNVSFAGWVPDVAAELAAAGMVLASAPTEPCGLVALEAMAAGVPVVACAGGGHLETVGRLADPPMFAPGDGDAAADALRSLLPVEARSRVSRAGRELVQSAFTVERHVDRLLEAYDSLPPRRNLGRGGALPRMQGSEPSELVVCSLEPWDAVWRRNQFLADGLLRRDPGLRMLFVEPPADPIFDLSRRRRPALPSYRVVGYGGRLRSLRPLKILPRRAGPAADAIVLAQVRAATRLLRFSRPTLWLNDVTYAPLIRRLRWPTVYDVTDDWTKAASPNDALRRHEALERLALEEADDVVVCSRSLAESRGRIRPVTLIPNAVDVEHFQRPRPRPSDLPGRPVAVYVGSLHQARLDVTLVAELAQDLPEVAIVLVGPDSLDPRSRATLTGYANVSILGARPYDLVPAYLQHADVIIVPHLVNPFTESLDPIKAYECAACRTPTVATPVAGFRELESVISVVARDEFCSAVAATVSGSQATNARGDGQEQLPEWHERVEQFHTVLKRVARRDCRRPSRGIDQLSGRREAPLERDLA